MADTIYGIEIPVHLANSDDFQTLLQYSMNADNNINFAFIWHARVRWARRMCASYIKAAQRFRPFVSDFGSIWGREQKKRRKRFYRLLIIDRKSNDFN